MAEPAEANAALMILLIRKSATFRTMHETVRIVGICGEALRILQYPVFSIVTFLKRF